MVAPPNSIPVFGRLFRILLKHALCGIVSGMLKKTVLCLATIAMATMASAVQAGENCTCRYKGEDVGEGKFVCMKTADGFKMAQCSTVLNNTAWKFTDQPCPYSSLNQTPVEWEMFEALRKRLG